MVIKNSKEQMTEHKNARHKFDLYKSMKDKQNLLKKRERCVRGNWRNGILGIELEGEDLHGSVFYSTTSHIKKNDRHKEK
jgi:hypothetical protein